MMVASRVATTDLCSNRAKTNATRYSNPGVASKFKPVAAVGPCLGFAQWAPGLLYHDIRIHDTVETFNS